MTGLFACKRCGHDQSEHRRSLDEDPRDALFPCIVEGCSCPDTVHPSDSLWRIIVSPIDSTDAVEILELSSRFSRVHVEPAGGVIIETNPTGFGDYRDSRLIPWSRLLDFRTTGPA